MFDAPVVSVSPQLWGVELTLALPAAPGLFTAAGRFFLARCTDGDESTRAWDPYLRQPLFPVAREPRAEATLWTFLVQGAPSAATRWLESRRPGDSVNLLGPFGNGFGAHPQQRALLLAADAHLAPLLFPLIHPHLDAGGRITLLLRVVPAAPRVESLVQRLPFSVETHAEAPAAFAPALASLLPWADRLCLCLIDNDYAQMARDARAARLRLEEGFAQALTLPPLPCGVGACLACLVPLANGGFTRACIHGPVFDLTRLA